MPTSTLQHVPALPWEIWSHRLSRQHSTYVYIWMNHWIATTTTNSFCFENRQTCSKSHHLYMLEMSASSESKISNIDELKRHIKNKWVYLHHTVIEYWMCSWRRDSCWPQTFRAYNVKMMRLPTCLMIFETITASCARSYSMIH